MKQNRADDADALEAELHSLRPRALPNRLVRDIEAALANDSDGATRRPAPWLRVAAAAVGLAACVAVAAFLWRDRGGTPGTDPVVAVTQGSELLPPRGDRAGGVTLAEFRAAIARSPEAVDALLEQDGPRPLQPARRAASFRAFHGSALDLTTPAEP